MEEGKLTITATHFNNTFYHRLNLDSNEWTKTWEISRDTLDLNFRVTSKYDSILVVALKKKNFEVFDYFFLKRGGEIDFSNPSQNQLLYSLLELNYENGKKYSSYVTHFFKLLQGNCKNPKKEAEYLDSEIEFGSITTTVLHLVAKNNDLEVAKKIISKKVNIDSQDMTGTTPLGIATLNRYTEMINFLIENGANPKLANPTIIHAGRMRMSARFRNKVEILQNPKKMHGLNLMDKLIAKDIQGFKSYVIDDLRNFKSDLPLVIDISLGLWFAIDFQNKDFFDYLIEKDADINYLHPDFKVTPIMSLKSLIHETRDVKEAKYDELLDHILTFHGKKINSDSLNFTIKMTESNNNNSSSSSLSLNKEEIYEIGSKEIKKVSVSNLCGAIQCGDLKMIKKYIRPEFLPITEELSLHLIVGCAIPEEEIISVLELLLSDDFPVRFMHNIDTNEKGNTILHRFFSLKNFKVCAFLINKKSVSPTIKNNEDNSVWDLFMQNYENFVVNKTFVEEDGVFPFKEVPNCCPYDWKFPTPK